MEDTTYGIRGLPRPPGVANKTKIIPFAPGLPLRHNIVTLAESNDTHERKQWTLFILALERFKAKSIDDKLSYFRVAGLHGSPGQPWDNAPAPTYEPNDNSENSFGGYCNHNRLNFPTWHRPYLLLFEQCVWENMKAIIDLWVSDHDLPPSEAHLWHEEADQWRMPYWDWARQQASDEDIVYPEVLTTNRVQIHPPEILRHLYPTDGYYDNPLLRFESPEKDLSGASRPFGDMPAGKDQWNITDSPPTHSEALPQPDEKDSQWLPWSRTSATSRYGIKLNPETNDFTGLRGINDSRKAQDRLCSLAKDDLWYEPRKDEQVSETREPSNQAESGSRPWWNPGSLSDAVNRMISPGYSSTWAQFASTKWYGERKSDDGVGYLSLEYIHNNVHNIAGGTSWADGVGHLSDVPVAAFDPLFWLHHCQVDRLLAMWQCLNWDVWFDTSPETDNGDGPTTPLQPFHTKDGGDPNSDVWTAEQCRDWTHLNYQYDDIWFVAQRFAGLDGTLDETAFKNALQDHINLTYPGTGQMITSNLSSSISEDVSCAGDALSSLPATIEWRDYVINVVYDRYALQGISYTIEFYLGHQTSTSASPQMDPDLVGKVYTFSGGERSASAACGNCKKQTEMGVLSCAQVPLTIPLHQHVIEKYPELALEGISDAVVEQYLKDHLHWRFVQIGGTIVGSEKFPKTRIKVLCGIGKIRNMDLNDHGRSGSSSDWSLLGGDSMASYGGYTPLPVVTDGKPWGLRDKRHSLKRRRRSRYQDVARLARL